MINTVNSAIYSVIFLDQDLCDISWWRRIFSRDPAQKTYKLGIEQFDRFARFGLLHVTCSIYESFLRIILRSVDPGACSNGTSEFASIYTALFRTQLSAGYSDALELSNLLRHLRNTIHNNGIFFHKNKNDMKVNYRNKMYTFKFSREIDFVTWKFICEMLCAISATMGLVCLDPVIVSIPLIPDPIAQ